MGASEHTHRQGILTHVGAPFPAPSPVPCQTTRDEQEVVPLGGVCRPGGTRVDGSISTRGAPDGRRGLAAPAPSVSAGDDACLAGGDDGE